MAQQVHIQQCTCSIGAKKIYNIKSLYRVLNSDSVQLSYS